MSACANCAPKRGRYSAFPSRFVCIAPRAFLSNASSVGDPTYHWEKNGLSTTYRGGGLQRSL